MAGMINNILTVSRYESKLLLRSWFFRIFSILALFILFIYNLVILIVNEDASGTWSAYALPATIPYMNLVLLNVGQAIVAVFLASDFIKRDRKLDTSEVFYVHPLSNAEYVLGKIWGNIRVFLILNLLIMLESLIFTIASKNATVDWAAYPLYFLLVNVPTLVYIMGLSILLMRILKNQAITFVILLAYIGLSIFFLNDKLYSLFDYMAYFLPMMKSSIVGIPNLNAILIHRAIYIFAGMGFIFLSVTLFARIPNSPKSKFVWLGVAAISLIISGFAVYEHLNMVSRNKNIRLYYTEVNNQYVNSPKIVVDSCNISLVQQPYTFLAEAELKGRALSASNVFTFCLNPALEVELIQDASGNNLKFERKAQIILVDYGREIVENEIVMLKFKYSGKIDQTFCYLDIADKEYLKRADAGHSRTFSFQTPDYLLLTPENYWYPRSGTSYSTVSTAWQQSYFCNFEITVKPLNNLNPVSQGESVKNDDGTFSFRPEEPLQAITLSIGDYEKQSIVVDGVEYAIMHFKGHDYYSKELPELKDTIAFLIRDLRENIEREYHLSYPFRRFTIVETPAQFDSYRHEWTLARENIQPEMALMVEKGWRYSFLDVINIKKNQKKRSGNGGVISEKEAEINTFNLVMTFFNGAGDNSYLLYPQFFNFQYNIFSSEWGFINRMLEIYLRYETTNTDPNAFLLQQIADPQQREILSNYLNGGGTGRGLIDDEKANLLFSRSNLKSLLANPEYHSLSNSFFGQKMNSLFAESEYNIGITAFRDSVFALLKRNTFNNIRFENMLDTLSIIGKTDLKTKIENWSKPDILPHYNIETPQLINVNDKGKETFVLKLKISNISEIDGITELILKYQQGENDQRKIRINAGETKQITLLSQDPPNGISFNTYISGNIPYIVDMQLGRAIEEKRALIEKEEIVTIPNAVINNSEIIVDNEDSLLFSVTTKEFKGLLPKLFSKKEDTEFKYNFLSDWRPPIVWTETINSEFYGNYIHSAYIIKNGNGDQKATWKIPVPESGNYELFFHYYVRNNNQRGRGRNRNRGAGTQYNFVVSQYEQSEKVALDLQNLETGWESLGEFFINSDTLKVELTNESRQRMIIADAVKLSKKN